jgi:hypothetical protein
MAMRWENLELNNWLELRASGSIDEVTEQTGDSLKSCAPPFKQGDTISVYDGIDGVSRGWFMALEVKPRTREIFGLFPPGTKKGDYLISGR